MIIQAIIAGFVLASALVAACLAVSSVITAIMDRHEQFSVEFAKRRGDRT